MLFSKSFGAEMSQMVLVSLQPTLCQLWAEQLSFLGTVTTVSRLDEARVIGAVVVVDVEESFSSEGEALSLLVSRLKEEGARAVVLLVETSVGVPNTALFLEKPFRLSAFVATVQRAFEDYPETSVSLGDFRLFVSRREVRTEDGVAIRLTEKECAILVFLHQAQGLVKRSTLLQGVWGYSASVTTHTLETYIYRLRKKLEAHPPHRRILVTESGGYRLDLCSP